MLQSDSQVLGARINPLQPDALTVDTVQVGNTILSWLHSQEDVKRRLTIVNMPYTDGDGDLVVDVRHSDGHETTELTSTIGLTGDRYSGHWSAIAIMNKEEVS